MALLPIRTRVLHFMSTVNQADITEVMEGLKGEYGSERQFTKANFVDHMLSLKANGLIDEVSYNLEADGELCIYYKINEEGINTIQKYIPKKWREKK